MVIRQPINGAIFQSFADEAPRRHMSRGMSIAIGASIVAHVAVGIYLYNAAFNAPKPLVADEPQPPIVIYNPEHPKPPPPHPDTSSKQPPVHNPAPSPFRPLADPLPIDPPKPALRDPVDTTRTSATSDPGPQLIDTPKPRKITRPDWLSQPDASAMSRYYPERAQRLGVSGSATINCTVAANGTISGCDVVSETPSNYGFGDAARKLSRFFKMRPQMVDGQPVAGGTIEIPIQFRLSDN